MNRMISSMDQMIKIFKATEMSLSDAIKPLMVLFRLVGMNPKSYWHKMYTAFILICEFMLFYKIWQVYSHKAHNQNSATYSLEHFVHFLKDICRVCSLLIILGTGLFDEKRFMIPLQDFINIDQCLKSLGGRIDNRGTYRFGILLAIYTGLIPIFCWLSEYISHASRIIDDEEYRIFIIGWIRYVAIMTICGVADCAFVATLSIIKKRFKEINLIIHRAGKNGWSAEINFIEVSRKVTKTYSSCTCNKILRELNILRKQYHDLWGIANRVNEAYGLHLLVGATTTLELITSKLWATYYLFMNSEANRSYLVVECISCTVFYAMKIFLLVKASASTVTEANAVSIVIQELGMKGDYDPATKGEIRDFLTQLQLETRNFSACGFFDIDFTLISAITSAVCTYLVILIQMAD